MNLPLSRPPQTPPRPFRWALLTLSLLFVLLSAACSSTSTEQPLAAAKAPLVPSTTFPQRSSPTRSTPIPASTEPTVSSTTVPEEALPVIPASPMPADLPPLPSTTSTTSPGTPVVWPAAKPSIAAVGDSIAVGTQSYLPGILSARHPGATATFFAHGGWSLTALKPLFPQALAASSDVIWVQAGINDVFSQNPDASFPRDLETRIPEAMDSLPGRCVLWSTVSEVMPAAGWQARGKFVNDTVRQAAASRPWVRVVDIAPRLAEDPSLLSGDKLHLTGKGYQLLASMVVDSADTCTL